MSGYVMYGLLALALAFIFANAIAMAVSRKLNRPEIVVASLRGVLQYGDRDRGGFGQFMKHVAKVAQMKPKALIVRVNSPGGTVGASQEIHRALMMLRDDGIRVIAQMEDVAASGGLYACMAADHVVANPGTVTGSIGVIMKGYDLSRIFEMLEIRFNTVKSGPYKDIMSPSREMLEEEKRLLQDMIDDTHGQFCQAVVDGRGLTIEQVREFADGRVMTGNQALAFHMVDSLGGFNDAVVIARELAGIPAGRGRILCLENKPSFLERVGLRSSVETVVRQAISEASLSGLPLWLMSSAR